MSVHDGLTYPDIVRSVTSVPDIIRVPALTSAEDVAQEFTAIGRALTTYIAGAFDRMSAEDIARMSALIGRCRRNAEALREEHGR